MSKRVLAFPANAQEPSEIPRPVNARADSAYAKVDVVDDLYERAGFSVGAALVAHIGRIKEKHLHYIERGGYGFLARLSDATPAKIHLKPLDGQTPEGDYQRAELSLIGVIVELYPHGLDGPRWVLFPARSSSTEFPLVEAVAN